MGLPSNKISYKKSVKKRILIADKDTFLARRLGTQLVSHNFEVRYAISVNEAKNELEFWKPDLLFVDLILPETTAFSLLQFLQVRGDFRPQSIVVTSKQANKKTVRQLKEMGATAYLGKPYSVEQALACVNEQLTSEEVTRVPQAAVPIEAQREMNLVNLFVKQALSSPRDSVSLHNLMRMISLRTGALRVSVVQVMSNYEGMVLAANDDSLITGRLLSLEKYPEIQRVVKNREAFCVESQNDAALASVKTEFAQTPFGAIALFPIYEEGKFFGVMSLRLPRDEKVDLNYVRSFGGFCSSIISLTIGIHA